MSKNFKSKVERLVKKWAKENEVSLLDTSFYSPKEWRDRGEEYCLNSTCIIASEGDLCSIWNGYCDNEAYGWALLDSFFNMLQENGLWYELGCHWYAGIYEN